VYTVVVFLATIMPAKALVKAPAKAPAPEVVCPGCGNKYKGQRGLTTHQKSCAQTRQEEVRAVVTAMQPQIVNAAVYRALSIQQSMRHHR
jgi:hypothetical protein